MTRTQQCALCRDVRYEHHLQLYDAVLNLQFSLLESPQLKLIEMRLLANRFNHCVESAVFKLQLAYPVGNRVMVHAGFSHPAALLPIPPAPKHVWADPDKLWTASQLAWTLFS